MSWGNDHNGKTHYGRWENRLLDAYQGDDEDDDQDDEHEDDDR